MKSDRSTPRRKLELTERSCPTCGTLADETTRVVARGVDYEYDTCSNVFSFLQCPRCDTVFLSPSPARADFKVIYPESYYTVAESSGEEGAGHIIRWAWDLTERRRAVALIELLGDGARQVLDIGCGDGRLLRVLNRRGRSRWRLEGVDQGLRESAITTASREGITIREGFYEDLDLGGERFDLIVAQQVIEHSIEPGEMLEKAFGELVRGGHVVLDTPNYDGVDRRLFSRSIWGGYHFPRHMTLFTRKTLSQLARSRGFEVVSVESLLSPVYWIMTLHNVGVSAGLPRRVTSHLTYRSLPLIALATLIELPNVTILKRTSNMRMILRKPRS